MSIPVFSAAGNSRDYSRIDWPSCIPETVAVGAVDQIGEIASYSNNDSSLLDFFALGNMPAVGPGNISKNIAGTSSATQVAAATYLKLMTASGQSGNKLIDSMKANAVNTVGRQGTFKKLITLSNAVSATPTNSAAADAAAKALADAKAAADAKALADAKAAALKLEVNAGIAAAEQQYAIDLKAAQDKLAATKAAWMAKLNG